MSLASLASKKNTTSASSEAKDKDPSLDNTEASLLGALAKQPKEDVMDRTASSTYASQPGSHSTYPPALSESQPPENSTTQSSAAKQFTPSPGIKSNTGSPPEYGVYPTSACSSSFPEQVTRQSHPPSNHSGSSGGMPPSASPSLPIQDGRQNHQPPSQVKSDQEVPIDPSIAASSPTYQTHGGQYSPYPPQPEIPQPYGAHPQNPMYAQTRPEWAGYSTHPQHSMQGSYTMAGAHCPPAAAPTGVRPGQVSHLQHSINQVPRGYSTMHPRTTQSFNAYQMPVYSFVPIPGAQQHKRPRRRYEEIERMYKCGWNGCEKAYGTLNHLNAHVTMQAHGSKRTPEEFKEIRKEWKARKKEEENQRKAEEDRNRVVAPSDSHREVPHQSGYPPNARPVQLPPISFPQGPQISPQYQTAPQSNVQQIPQEYPPSQQPLTYSGYPASPYGAQTG